MTQYKKQKKLLYGLIISVVLMFAFAFALVPLYDTLCRALGINGKVEQYVQSGNAQADVVSDREVDIEFVVNQQRDLNWSFYPLTAKLAVVPGQSYRVDFYAENHSDHTMTVQAVPSITPTQTASYMQKVECFCFTQQTLAAGESITMPVVFTVDTRLPEQFSTLTLSYTLYDLSH